jgi:hypothetical protein
MNAKGPQRRASRQAPRTIAAPALVIRLPLEGAPSVEVECAEGEEERLASWVGRTRPEYGRLWLRAVELVEEARTA